MAKIAQWGFMYTIFLCFRLKGFSFVYLHQKPVKGWVADLKRSNPNSKYTWEERSNYWKLAEIESKNFGLINSASQQVF